MNQAPVSESTHSPRLPDSFRGTLGRLRFFGAGRGDDSRYLDTWRDAPLSYTPDMPSDRGWKTDRRETLLLARADADQFERAAELFWRYVFYPPSVMLHTSDFSQAQRPMQPGDRIIQRIVVFPGLLDLLTMNQIHSLMDETRRRGFTYWTTQRHDEIGTWSAWVEWRADGSLWVIMDAWSRIGYHIPFWLKPLVRFLQKRAHRLGPEYLRAQLTMRS